MLTETISEVQKILQKDPKLPRLTRGEIEDLFEMVTREEYKRSLAAGDYQRAKHMRSLMLVLPLNTNNYSEERLEVKILIFVQLNRDSSKLFELIKCIFHTLFVGTIHSNASYKNS